jgi:hypothetical protein
MFRIRTGIRVSTHLAYLLKKRGLSLHKVPQVPILWPRERKSVFSGFLRLKLFKDH